jgi:hypothetical protein
MPWLKHGDAPGIGYLEAFTESRRAAKHVKVTLGVGIVLLLAVLAFTLTHSPARVVRVGTQTQILAGTMVGGAEVCQTNEVLPAGVSAIRFGQGGYIAAPISLKVLSGSRVVAQGSRGPVWTGTSVTVPVKPLASAVAPVTLCAKIGPTSELVFFRGIAASGRRAAFYTTGERVGTTVGGRIGVEYLTSSNRSWWSRILFVARHMGLGHALSGTWVVLLIAALMALAGLLALRIALRELP